MKVIYNNIIPFKGFIAINLFGVIFVRKKYKLSKTTLNHESIHTAQMKELGYILFYVLYFIEWIIRLICIISYNISTNNKKDLYYAYRNISFEQEAYDNEDNLNYKHKPYCSFKNIVK